MPVQLQLIDPVDNQACQAINKIYRDDPDFSLDHFLQKAQATDSQLYGGWFNGTWIAIARLRLQDERRILEELAVHPATRRRGTGRYLLSQLQQLDATPLFIAAPNSGEARAFLTACGYQPDTASPESFWFFSE